MEEQLMKEFFKKSLVACAFQKVILDENGVPCKYKFTEVNEQFEKLSGLKAVELIGNTFANLFKDHYNKQNNWMKTLEEASLNNKKIIIDTYDEVAGKYLRVKGFPIDKDYCAIMIADGTEEYIKEKQIEEELKKFNLELTKLAEELKQKNKELEFVANRDKLTSLYNRHFFDEIIDHEMDKADINNEIMSLVIFDLDHFKNVNDTWGHPAGDVVLKTIAEIVRNSIRKWDVLFRWGGEEFIILMKKTNADEAVLVADKIRKEIEGNIFGEVGHLTCSFGVSERVRYEMFRTWYKKADEAVYKAKDEGRNRVVSFNEQKNEAAVNVSLKWNTKWECGDLLIDKQHYEILENGSKLMNRSFLDIKSKEFTQELEKFLEHIQEHFNCEEKLLQRVKYENIKEHLELHKELTKKTLRLKKYYENGELKRSDLFSFILDDVIIGHLVEQDVLFFSYIK